MNSWLSSAKNACCFKKGGVVLHGVEAGHQPDQGCLITDTQLRAHRAARRDVWFEKLHVDSIGDHDHSRGGITQRLMRLLSCFGVQGDDIWKTRQPSRQSYNPSCEGSIKREAHIRSSDPPNDVGYTRQVPGYNSE